MKIASDKFKEFVEKVTMNGSIGMVVLDFIDEGISVKSKTLDNAGAGFGILHSKVFQNYQAIGQVGIKNVAKLMNMLTAIKGIISLEIQGNKFVMYNDSQMWSLTIANAEYIDNYLEKEPGMPFDGGVSMESAILKNALITKGIVEADFLVIECKDKKLSITAGDDNSDKGDVKIECDYNNFRASYGSVLDSAIKVLGGKVNMACADNYPIRLKESTDEYSVTLIMAPVDEEKVEDMKPDTQQESTTEPKPVEPEVVEPELPIAQ